MIGSVPLCLMLFRCYCVFSYGSDCEFDQLAEVVNEEMTGVRRHFWPKALYVLGKGMLIPGEGHGVPLDSRTMFTGSKFLPVRRVGAPGIEKSEAHSFLWFLSNKIDHCFAQRGERKSPSCKGYWFQTIQAQVTLNRQLAEGKDRRRSDSTGRRGPRSTRPAACGRLPLRG